MFLEEQGHRAPSSPCSATTFSPLEKNKPHARNALGNALKPPLFPPSPGSFSLLGLQARFLQEPQLRQALLPPPALPWGDADGGEIPLAGSGQDHDIPGKKKNIFGNSFCFLMISSPSSTARGRACPWVCCKMLWACPCGYPQHLRIPLKLSGLEIPPKIAPGVCSILRGDIHMAN